MNFGYISSQNQLLTLQQQTERLNDWSSLQNIKLECIQQDEQFVEFQSGDFVVVNNMSVFGRNVSAALSVISELLQKKVRIFSIDSNCEISGDEMKQAFQMCLKIFKDIIASSTKAGLEKAKLQGRVGGRRTGQKPAKTKLSAYEDEIRRAMSEGVSKTELARRYNVTWATMNSFLKKISD